MKKLKRLLAVTAVIALFTSYSPLANFDGGEAPTQLIEGNEVS